MKTVRISSLSGGALVYAVAVIEGQKFYNTPRHVKASGYNQLHWATFRPGWHTVGNAVYDLVSGCWNANVPDYLHGKDGDDIIDREKIGVSWKNSIGCWLAAVHVQDDMYSAEGTTRRLAAMRCYIASKHGATVDVPEELL